MKNRLFLTTAMCAALILGQEAVAQNDGGSDAWDENAHYGDPLGGPSWGYFGENLDRMLQGGYSANRNEIIDSLFFNGTNSYVGGPGHRFTRITTHTYDFPDSDPANISTAYYYRNDDCATTPQPFAEVNTESCFAYDAKVLMADGTVKKIGEVAIGDNTAYGPVRQTYIRRFDQGRTAMQDFQIVYRGGLYEYRGILVTGNHVVKSNGRWLAIAELKDVQPVFAPHVGNVYNLDVEGGVIPVVDADGAIIPFLDDKQFIAARHLVA